MKKITFHFIFQDINIFYDYFIMTNQSILVDGRIIKNLYKTDLSNIFLDRINENRE